MFVHCRRIYNLFVRALETCRQQAFGELFKPVSPRVQINEVFLVHKHEEMRGQHIYTYSIPTLSLKKKDRCRRHRMVVGFTTTYAISAYHH